MVDKISSASPATAATGPASGADFAKELARSTARSGSSPLKTQTPAGAQAAKRQLSTSAAQPSSARAAQRPEATSSKPPLDHADRAGASRETRAASSTRQTHPATSTERAQATAPAGEPTPIERPSGAQILSEVQRAQARLDQILKMAESGRSFSPAELIAFQAHTYRASQELDMAGKVVEKSTSAVKQTLQTQI
jgi:hypothetical protein